MRCVATSIFLYALWIKDPHSRAAKKNTTHGNEMLPQGTTHLTQRPCYQWRSPCPDPAGNRATRRPLTIVKSRKLKWYGHVSPSSDLAKTILLGTVKGGRRQGRQKRKWEDNIKEWDFFRSFQQTPCSAQVHCNLGRRCGSELSSNMGTT